MLEISLSFRFHCRPSRFHMIPSPLPAPSLPSSSQPGTARFKSFSIYGKVHKLREEGQRNLAQRWSYRPCKAWVRTSALGIFTPSDKPWVPTKWWGGWQRPPHSDKSMQANWGVAAPELLWFWRRENSIGSEKMETKSRGNQTTGNFFTSPKHTMNLPHICMISRFSTSQPHSCCRFACILFFLIFCSPRPSSSPSTLPYRNQHSTRPTKKAEGFN